MCGTNLCPSPAHCLRIKFAEAREQGTIVLALAADHLVRDTNSFGAAASIAAVEGSVANAAQEVPSPLRAMDRGTRTAQVSVNELAKTVHENESIDIPIGAVHRLYPGKIRLELIAVLPGRTRNQRDAPIGILNRHFFSNNAALPVIQIAFILNIADKPVGPARVLLFLPEAASRAQHLCGLRTAPSQVEFRTRLESPLGAAAAALVEGNRSTEQNRGLELRGQLA